MPALQSLSFTERQLMWFQQDGAPPHGTKVVREFLRRLFYHQWIGRNGPVAWPARSPDLTPLDFFLWGYLKNKIYRTFPNTVDELKRNIKTAIEEIEVGTLKKVMATTVRRMLYCKEQNGRHFEQLIG